MDLRAALARAPALVDLRARLRAGLADRRPRRVLAIGKAASAMVNCALDVRGDSIEAALVVIPDGAPAPREDARVRLMRASHPLPDERSVLAGEAALAFGADLALISGGTSSLVFVPVDSLEEARAAFAALLVSGASIREINVVRRHTSLAHGGRLGPIDTLIVSDVIEGAASDIGSGPTVDDPTTLAHAREVLATYAPGHAHLLLRESRKESRPGQLVEILVAPDTFASAVARELVAEGLRPRVAPHTTDDVHVRASLYEAIARKGILPGEAIVCSAEPSLRIDVASPGSGGRCTHLAALVARMLPAGITFMAAASDGVDGTSGTAGAIVTSDSFPDRALLDAAIAAFDTGPLHLARGTALPLGATGVNFADVHVLARP